jgi:hypothetical protein
VDPEKEFLLYEADTRAAPSWELSCTGVEQDLPITGLLGDPLLGKGGRSKI